VDIRTLGGSAVQISAIGLGGYELGGDPSEDGLGLADAVAVAQAALAEGINWIDTSEAYHDNDNESLIGDVLGGGADDLLVSTKLAPLPDGTGFRREQVHAGCRASLARLGRDVIDIFFLHWPDETGVPLEETWGALAELVDEGLVRAIGLSNYEQEAVERCHAERSVDVVQIGLSLVDHLDNLGPTARCGELGIGVVIYEPLASGILTGKSLEEIQRTWGDEYAEWSFFNRLLAPGKVDQTFAVADGMRPLASQVGASVAQLAIAWVLHQQGVTAAIVGSRDPDHVRQSARAAYVRLRADVLQALGALIPFGPTVGTDVGPGSST